MTSKINKVFVYGTLLQGETLCHHMQDCKLLQTLEIPGSLYDTQRGYPTAVFNKNSKTQVVGELYMMERPESKIKELDELEMTESGQYSRVILNHKDIDFFTYEAARGLEPLCRPMYEIDSGNWRMHSSICFVNPVGFARAFEDRQKYLYREPNTDDYEGAIYLKGEAPILISAPHSCVHERMGKPKRQEFYTGAISSILHSLTGCHAIYLNRSTKKDPNYYDDAPYKAMLAQIVETSDIKFLIDLHGTDRNKKYDIYPGVGINNEFMLGHNYLEELEQIVELNELSLGGLDVFPAAKQMTVTKYAARVLNVPSIQLEVSRRQREPEENPDEFLKLIKCLSDFIERLCYLVG